MTDLLTFLDKNARINPRKSALFYDGTAWTASELLNASRTKAGALRRMGVEPGDRLLLGLSPPNYFIALLACVQLGAIAVPLTRRETPREVEAIRLALAPTRSVFDSQTAETMHASQAAGTIMWDRLDGDMETFSTVIDPDAIAVVHFSSGSTGRPKPIPRSVRNLSLEGSSVADAIPLDKNDTVFCTTPLQHSYAGGLMAACISSGAALAVIDGFRPSAIIDTAARLEATILAGTPYLFCALGALKQREKIEMPKLRFGIVGGAYLPTKFINQFQEKFDRPLIQEYGLSEGGIVSFNTVNHAAKPTSIGRPIDGVTASIVGSAGNQLPPGAVGELVVERRGMPTAYLDQPEETARVFSGLSVRTGDLAYKDDDGDLFLVGRLKQMINVSGNKVSPAEVLEVVTASGLVADAAVIGIENAETGEAVGAVVVPSDGIDEQVLVSQLLRYCRQELAAHKVPRRMEIRSELPRLTNGKIDMNMVLSFFEKRSGP